MSEIDPRSTAAIIVGWQNGDGSMSRGTRRESGIVVVVGVPAGRFPGHRARLPATSQLYASAGGAACSFGVVRGSFSVPSLSSKVRGVDPSRPFAERSGPLDRRSVTINPRGRGIWMASAVVALALRAVPARADADACSAAPTSVARQDCLLAAAMPKPGDGDLTGSHLGALVTAPLSDDAFRPVTAEGVVSDPAAVLHHPVAIASARCFSFGVGDYRCIVRAAVPVAVATAIVIPPEAEVAVERGCTVGEAPDCSRRILFVPTSFRRTQLSGEDAVVFRTANVIVAPAVSGASTQRAKP